MRVHDPGVPLYINPKNITPYPLETSMHRNKYNLLSRMNAKETPETWPPKNLRNQ